MVVMKEYMSNGKKLQNMNASNFPIPISYLLDGFWGSVNAKIIHIEEI